jgi:uncharacterized protein YbbK (DUF523 family)
MIVVSACLAGEKCRYDGNSCLFPQVRELVRSGKAVPVCPEVLGGLPVPRERCELRRDPDGKARIVSERGRDFTAEYAAGAQAALSIAQAAGATTAVLKSLSPSCGHGEIYDGSFTGRRTAGHGMAAELLSRHGIRVYTEAELPALEGL